MNNQTGYWPTEKMLSPSGVAAMLDVNERHLCDVSRTDATFPAPCLGGTLPRWSPALIRAWVEAPDRKGSALDNGVAPATAETQTRRTKTTRRVH